MYMSAHCYREHASTRLMLSIAPVAGSCAKQALAQNDKKGSARQALSATEPPLHPRQHTATWPCDCPSCATYRGNISFHTLPPMRHRKHISTHFYHTRAVGAYYYLPVAALHNRSDLPVNPRTNHDGARHHLAMSITAVTRTSCSWCDPLALRYTTLHPQNECILVYRAIKSEREAGIR